MKLEGSIQEIKELLYLCTVFTKQQLRQIQEEVKKVKEEENQ